MFILLIFSLSTCSIQVADTDKQQTVPTLQSVVVATEVVSPDLYPSPTLVICTSLPHGMILLVNPVSTTAVRVEIIGLQAGENVILILRSQSDGYTDQMEEHPVTPADSNGHSSEIVNGLSPKMKHWIVQVIHSRCVACTEVDLP